MATLSTYSQHVQELESSLASYAFRYGNVRELCDGSMAIDALEQRWTANEASLVGRTPAALERDRILYSDALRTQSDKHHILFWNSRRVVRDYTTHTLRVAQIARSITARLNLNEDLAEAIALGSKVGAVPFIHVAKNQVAEWIEKVIRSQDTKPTEAIDASRNTRRATAQERRQPGTGQQSMWKTDFGELVVPSWIDSLNSAELRSKVQAVLPWAAGDIADQAYSSGQESYWVLATNPFQFRLARAYLPQTLYGIWRHSMPGPSGYSDFHHTMDLGGEQWPRSQVKLTHLHATHEAVVVRYADDITWVIENLSEANKASAFSANERNSVYAELHRTLRNEAPQQLALALANADPGEVYTYFVDALVSHTQETFSRGQIDMTEAQPSVSLTALSARMLSRMKDFLELKVFSQTRTEYRNRVLSDLTVTVLEILRTSPEASIPLIERRAIEESWTEDELSFARDRYESEPVEAIQMCVDMLASMSDREVYDLIGLD